MKQDKREIVGIRVGSASGMMTIHHWPVSPARARVICLHGIGSCGAEFAPMAQALNERGYDVVCPDWIGHGDSQYLWRRDAYRWETYLRCATGIARRYGGGPTHYVGLSWGAMMLLLFLAGSRVEPRSATFVDVPLTSNPALAQSAAGLRIQSEAAFDSEEEIERFLFDRRPELRATPAEWRDHFRAARFQVRDGKYVMKFDPAAIGVLEYYGTQQFDNFPALDRFGFECLFLYGRFSPYRNPQRFAEYVAKQPNLHYSDLLDAAHPPALFEEHQFGPIVSFIEASEEKLRR